MSLEHPSKVVIGVPIYNGEDRIALVLDSLLAQTYPNVEIVISDNHSTDQTPQILDSFAEQHEKITVHTQPENIGMYENFKYVAELADGDYFMWAASDDTWEADAVSILVTTLKENPDSKIALGSWRSMPDVNSNDAPHTVIYSEANKPENFSDFQLALKMIESNAEAYFMCIYGLGETEYMKKLSRNFGSTMAMDRCVGVEVALSGNLCSSDHIVLSKYVASKGHMTRFKGDPAFAIREKSRLKYCFYVWFDYMRCLTFSELIPIKNKIFVPLILLKFGFERTLPMAAKLFVPEMKDLFKIGRAYVARRIKIGNHD